MTTKGYKDVKMRNVSKQRMALYIEWAAKKKSLNKQTLKIPNNLPKKKAARKKK